VLALLANRAADELVVPFSRALYLWPFVGWHLYILEYIFAASRGDISADSTASWEAP